MKVGDLVKITHWSSNEPEQVGLYINEYERDGYEIIYEVMIGNKVDVFSMEDGWDFEVINESR